MSERDDWIAATGGGGNMVSRRKKPRRWGRGQGNELSALLLEQLGLPEGNVTIEASTDELKVEGFPATVKVTKSDGTEVAGSEVAQALQNILSGQEQINTDIKGIRTSQTWNTKFAMISVIGGVILGNIDRLAGFIAQFVGSSVSGSGLY